MQYYIALTINGKEDFYELNSRREKLFFNSFKEPTELTEDLTIKARNRTQYELVRQKGVGNPLPEALRQRLHKIAGFPLSELDARFFRVGDRLVYAKDPITGESRHMEYLQLGYKPVREAQIGDILYLNPSDTEPFAEVVS